MYTGPHIIKDGLVFGYDTGYGIADIETSTRFYPGKPTVNYVTDANTMTGWNSYSSGNDGTFVTEFGTTGYRINNRASWNGLYKGISVPATGIYTCSALIRYIGGSSDNNGATVYVSQYGAGDTSTSIDKSKIGEWQRIEKTVNVTDTDLFFIFYLISFGGTNATSSWEVTMPQVELASGRTPFVNGTRSSTASLIDLKETASIDVSNVSFDSTGQPDFDGTDDKGVVTNFPHIWDSSLSVESVVSWDDDTRSVIFGNYNQGTGGHDINFEKNPGGVLRFYWDRGSRDVYTTGNPVVTTSGAYHHVVFIRDAAANNFKFYVDGELVTTVDNAGSGISSTGSTFRFGADTRNGATVHNGSIPVIKAYNKALTATEIKQNFNAYKNRFSI
tara:strand:+ start:1025 stop:2188 length:1164 start_codon:yes stop_codon:yes gene_type:complete